MLDRLDRLRRALADRYVIEDQIGAGGMATVFLAEDLKHDRHVAIKVLHPELASHGYHPERFLREIKTVAGLTHPNILPLHDSGERGGFLFFVMPFVEGESLRRRLIRDRQLGIDEAIRITRTVAGALDYAHKNDVLHRDIKPENILFQEGQPLVADFGISRAISECCDDLGEAGAMVGTPEYVSPEQASAKDELDGRSDVYSLACVLYEMLAGGPPFGGSDVREILARHVAEAVPPVRSVRAEVPEAVGWVLGRALEKDPAERYATAADFRDALGEALSQPEHPAFARARGDATIIAVLPFVNASSDPDSQYLSDGITDELINALTRVEGLQVVSRTSVFALKGESRDVRSIGALLGASAVLEGTVRKAGTRLRIAVQLADVADGHGLWSERYDRDMQDVFAIEDEIAQTIVNTLRSTILQDIGDPTPRKYTANVTAYNLYLKGRYHWNRRTHEGITDAIEHFEQAITEDPEYAPAYSGLADCHSLQTDYRGIPTVQGMERAKLEARRALELDDTLAEAHTSLAWVTFIYDWDWDTAGRGFARAIELNPGYATARQWYAWLLMALDRRHEALTEGHMAQELDPISVSVRRTLGWLYYYARQPDTAVLHLRRAVEVDPTSTENQRILGHAYTQSGLYDEAERAFREAISLSHQSAYAIAGLGYLSAIRGRTDEAKRLLDQLLEQARQQYVSPVALVTVYLGLSDHDLALKWLDRAHEERRGWLAYLKVEPQLDALRGNPRFDELLRRMRLE